MYLAYVSYVSICIIICIYKSYVSANNLVELKVVWRDTKQLGLGIAQQGRQYIVVGRYQPSGNWTCPGYYQAAYARNVAPLIGSGLSLPD